MFIFQLLKHLLKNIQILLLMLLIIMTFINYKNKKNLLLNISILKFINKINIKIKY
jgi:hypothetical protein